MNPSDYDADGTFRDEMKAAEDDERAMKRVHYKYGSAQYSCSKKMFCFPVFGPHGVLAWCEDKVEGAAEAKAEFVARSVNSHGALLAALKKCQMELDGWLATCTAGEIENSFSGMNEANRLARKAIANSEVIK